MQDLEEAKEEASIPNLHKSIPSYSDKNKIRRILLSGKHKSNRRLCSIKPDLLISLCASLSTFQPWVGEEGGDGLWQDVLVTANGSGLERWLRHSEPHPW